MLAMWRNARTSFAQVFALTIVLMLAACQTGVGAAGAARHGTYGRGITCGSELTSVHYHADLQIYVNGRHEPVPAGVGFATDASGLPCLYWLHTHSPDGVIHIEAPTNRVFTLGDFIGIWSLSLTNSIPAGPPRITSTSFFGQPIDAQHRLTVYVNGQAANVDPLTLVLQAHEDIWLEYGAPQMPPTPFNWAGTGL